ncbi:MAG TPA: hypothetical protein VFL54_06795 [Gammaproteobacteria bacterium]|nr:hypothetical protein [Gammaproteobacteria bacterium]
MQQEHALVSRIESLLADLGVDDPLRVYFQITIEVGFRYPHGDAPAVRDQLRKLAKLRDAMGEINNIMAGLPESLRSLIGKYFYISSLGDPAFIRHFNQWAARETEEGPDPLIPVVVGHDISVASVRTMIQHIAAAQTFDEFRAAVVGANPLAQCTDMPIPDLVVVIRNLYYSLELARIQGDEALKAVSKGERDRLAFRDQVLRNVLDILIEHSENVAGDWESLDTVCDLVTLIFKDFDLPVPASGDTTTAGEEAQGRLRRMIKEYLQTKSS